LLSVSPASVRAAPAAKRQADRVARVQGLQAGQFLRVALDQVRQLQQDTATVHRRQVAPSREGRLRGGDGLVHIGPAGHRHLGDDRVVVGVEGRQGLAGLGFDELAIDEKLVAHRRAQACSGCDVCEIHGDSTPGRTRGIRKREPARPASGVRT